MKNNKITAIAVAVAAATSLSIAGPAAHSVEINSVDSADNTCKVTFTEREKANFARIQAQAATDLVAAYEANKSNFEPMLQDFIDAQSRLFADYSFSTYLGQSLTESEKAALAARADKAETDWYAWVDADPANREQYRYSPRQFAQNFGDAQFAVAAQNNTEAMYKAFVEGRGNLPKSMGDYRFGAINQEFTANDELSMYYSVGLPERSNFRPDEKIASAMDTFLLAQHAPHSLTAQYACAEYAKSFTEDHPMADELARGKETLALGIDSGNEEYNQAVIRVPKIEALIAQGTVPTDVPAYFVSEDLADETTADIKPQPDPAPSLPGSNDDGFGGILGIIAGIVGVLSLLAALIPGLSQFLNFGR